MFRGENDMKRQLTWKTIILSIVGATSLVAVAGLIVAVEVGHGTATPQAQVLTVPSALSLCTVANKVTTLTVHRGTFMNPTTFSFPSVVFVGNAASARSVAKAICAIPPDMRTGGVIACPADFGLTYRLLFTFPKHTVTPITLRVTGCGGVDGTGTKGWIHLTPNLLRVLGNAMQLRLATEATFRGKMA
jgi:hypothetical protein